MEMKELTADEVRAALQRAVDFKGADYVYRGPRGSGGSCWYANPNGTPSCIVGHVFADIDPEFYARLRKMEQDTGLSATVETIFAGDDPEKWGLHPPRIGADVTEALSRAQAIQDTGRTWGDALEGYDRAMGDVNECGH